MNRTNNRKRRNFKAYIRRTFANKVVAIAMVLFGLLTMMLERDVTLMAIALFFGIPLFFARKDHIYCLGWAA